MENLLYELKITYELASLYGLSFFSVRNLIYKKIITGIKAFGLWRVSESEFKEYYFRIQVNEEAKV